MATLPAWLTRLWSIDGRPAAPLVPDATATVVVEAVRAPTPMPPRASVVRRGRVSRDSDQLAGLGAMFNWIVPPADWENSWRLYQLDRATLDKIEPGELLKALADLSPEMSAAIWYFQRLCNPGWSIAVTGVDGTSDNPEGQAVIDDLLARMAERHGAVEVVINRLFMSIYLRGAIFAEAIFDPTGRFLDDIATPDPITARFRRQEKAGRGWYWQLGQQVQGNFLPLDDLETIAYVPIDPFPDSPYGRPMLAPALFTCLMTIGIIHDLRRVISQQGYPRYDVSILYERAIAAMPAITQNNPEQFKLWLDGVFDEVAAAYAKLEPDDAFIHFDHITVNRPTGAVDAGSLRAIDGLFDMLNHQIARAVKMPPIVMGITDGVSEANSNRQWEMVTATTKAAQHPMEQVLGRFFTLALQAQGVQGSVSISFAEVRAAEMLRDATTEEKRIANAQAKYQAGWIDQAEAAMEITGHEPAEEEPRAVAVAPAPDGSTPGGNADGEPATDEDMADRASYTVTSTTWYTPKRGAETSGETNGHHKGSVPTGTIVRAPWEPAPDDDPPSPATPSPDPQLDDRASAEWDHRMGDDWAGMLEADLVPATEDV